MFGNGGRSCGVQVSRNPPWTESHRISSQRGSANALLGYLSPHGINSRDHMFVSLVSVSGRVILRTDHQTAPLLSTLVDGFADIDELLLVLENKVELVVVTGAQIDHHVFVAEEPHDGTGIVELVHLVEIGDLVNVAKVDNAEVLDALGDLVEDLILPHAVGVPVAAEADADQTLLLAEDGLVDMPAGGQMGKDDGTHGL